VGNDDFVGMQTIRTSCQRDERHSVAGDRPRPDAGIDGRRHVHQLVRCDLIVASQCKQQLQGGRTLSRFQPGQGADRDPGREGDLGQRRPPLFAQRPQTGSYRFEHLVERIPGLPGMGIGVIIRSTEC